MVDAGVYFLHSSSNYFRMSLKIKAKAQEDTAMEKRNTSIAVFASVAAVPLIFTFLVGMGLGRGERTNTENLQDRVLLLERELDSLKHKQENADQDLILLERTLHNMDTFVMYYKNVRFSELNEDLEGVERDREFDSWERDMDDLFDEFDHTSDRFGRKVDFVAVDRMNQVLNYAKRWFREIRRAKEDEFLARKDIIRMELGVEASEINEDQIMALKEKLDECERELYSKDNAISGLEKDISLNQSSSAKEIEDEREKITELEEEINELKGNADKISDGIIVNVDAIRGELSSLKGQKWMQIKKDDMIDPFKDKIEIQLKAVERAALGLK